ENPYENVFIVDIEINKSISKLKNAIKKKKIPEFDNFATNKLKL
ncbi:13364_t:CDS:1, partial [Funneliformis mosseae]